MSLDQRIIQEFKCIKNELIEIHNLIKSSEKKSNIKLDTNNINLELMSCKSLMDAIIETTIDGVLVVDLNGKIISYNTHFIKMWHVNESINDKMDDDKLLAFVIDQIADPEYFLSKVRKVYNNINENSFDIILFKDGRVYERFSRPQINGNQPLGRVWVFRDISPMDILKKQKKIINDKLDYFYKINLLLSNVKQVDDLLDCINKIFIQKISESYVLYLLNNDEKESVYDFYYPDQILKDVGKQILKKNIFDCNDSTGIQNVLKTGKSEIYSETNENLLMSIFPNSLFVEVIKRMRVYSLLLLPILINHKPVGVIALFSNNVERHYTNEDLEYIELIGDRISQKIENIFLKNKSINYDSKKKYNDQSFFKKNSFYRYFVSKFPRTILKLKR